MLVRKSTKYILIGAICLILLSTLAWARLSGSLAPEAIAERLKPIGTVNVLGGSLTPTNEAAVVGLGGPDKIYADNCKVCHQTGLAGAPKFGDKNAWAIRLKEQGFETLVKTAWEGIRAMPPKGNCLKCTEADFRDTVQYMLDNSS